MRCASRLLDAHTPRDASPPTSLNLTISAEKSVSISVKTFFFLFLETTWFWAEKTLEFLRFPRNFVSIFGQTDARTMKIRVKVVCTFLTLSKKPPLFQILATRLVPPPDPWNSRSIANFWLRTWLQHIRIFAVLCLKFLLSPPPKFSGSATAHTHTWSSSRDYISFSFTDLFAVALARRQRNDHTVFESLSPHTCVN